MNMKRLLTLVAFFATVQASAQQVNPVPDYVFANRMSAGRNTVTDTAAYFSIGPRYGATRGMMPPMVVDTASFSANKRNGLLIFSVQKNKFLYWDSIGVKWAEMAGTGGSAITGSGVAGYMPEFTTTTNLDTTRLYHSAGRFAIGSTTTSNGVFNVYGNTYLDSTIRVKSDIFHVNAANRYVGIGTDTANAYLTIDSRNNYGLNSLRLYGALRPDGINRYATDFDGTIPGMRTNGYISILGNSNIPFNLSIAGHTNYMLGIDSDVGDSTAFILRAGKNYMKVYDNGNNLVWSISEDGSTQIGVNSNPYIDLGKRYVTGNHYLRIKDASLTSYFGTDIRPRYILDNTGLKIGNGTKSLDSIGISFKLESGDRIGSINVSDGSTLQQRLVFDGVANTLSMPSGNEMLLGSTSDAGTYTLQVYGSIYNTTGGVFAVSSGNVAIGAASASAKLDVSSTLSSDYTSAVRLRNSASGTSFTNVAVEFWDRSSNVNAAIVGTRNNIAGNWAGDLVFKNQQGGSPSTDPLSLTEVMRLDGNSKRIQFSPAGTEKFRMTDGEFLVNTITDNGAYALQVSGNIYNTGSITTGAPSGGSIKPWKIGEAATVSPTSPNRTLRVEVDGVVYYLHAKTTND